MKAVYLLALALLLGLTGCAKDPIGAPVQTDNPQFKVERLFTQDRCTVYRFADGGRDHYFANCPGSSVSEQQSCGKNCRYDQSLETR